MFWNKRMRIFSCLLPAGAAMLGGCTPADVRLGEAHRWNVAQQTLNPDPVPPAEGAPIEGGSGRKADSAVDHYQKGTVKQPEALRTDSASGGSGNSR